MCSGAIQTNRPLVFLYPHFREVEKGYTGYTLSVCPAVCPSVDGIMSALYLQQYLPDPFHIYTSYQATSVGVSHVIFFFFFFFSKLKNLNFWQFLSICNFDFVLFSLGIQYGSIVWVVMGQRRVSSECRHSSSSFGCFGRL